MKGTSLVLFLVLPLVLGVVALHLALVLDLAYISPITGALSLDKEREILKDVNESKCEVFHSNLEFDISSEDIVPIGENDDLFIYGTGDLGNLFGHGEKFAKPGGLFLIRGNWNANTPLSERIKIEKIDLIAAGYPKESIESLHCHGMYYSKQTGKLYVINHTGKHQIETVVEVFRIDVKNSHVLIKYLGTINGGWKHGMLNDIVENGDGELFVTLMLPYPFPLHGRKADNLTLSERFQLGKYLVSGLVNYKFAGSTGFLFCKYDLVKKGENAECAKVNVDFDYLGANGITIDKRNAKKNFLYVVDYMAKDVSMYSVPKKFETVTDSPNHVNYLRTIEVPDKFDNIYFDEKRKLITSGTVPLFYKFVQYESNGGKINVPGSMVTINLSRFNPDKPLDSDLDLSRVIYHPGDKLSVLSICVYGDDKHVICGSPFEPGVLICEA